jgi:hypothetical protein
VKKKKKKKKKKRRRGRGKERVYVVDLCDGCCIEID